METIGSNYRLIREKSSELGKGSFSIVYSGIYIGPDKNNIKKGTKVAIKIIKTHNLTKKALDILEDEISIMNLIKANPHPNIVQCYDVIRGSNEIYIIMELCDSGDLMTIIKRPIKEKYAQFYFCQLANGLKYLDSNSIIHRDIKPKNILLTNNRRVLKIADFGFAKRISDISLHETVCGSPLYMAPEIMNNHAYNNQTDLWSIGMILYEMLYGLHPFENCKSVPELKDQLKKTHIEIPPQNTQNTDVSMNCLDLLRNLLQKKATDRINWDEFFKHPWVTNYQYDIGQNSKPEQNEKYEKQLYSVSFGSLPENSPGKGIIPVAHKKPVATNSVPIIKNSKLESLTIIDDFYDQLTKNGSSPPDNCIFNFEEDDNDQNDKKNKKVIVRNVTEKSSILEEDADYSMIEENNLFN